MIGYDNLAFWNEYLNDIMKIVKSLEESGLLIKDVSKTAENEAKKNKKTDFYLCTLGTFSRCCYGN